MASQQQFLLFFCVLSVFMLVKADQNTTINNFVQHTCNRTHELTNLCLLHINSDPRDDLKTSLTGFLMIFVNHSIPDINNDILFLKNQLDSNNISRDTKDMYVACSKDYQTGLDYLQKTLKILQTKADYGDIQFLPVTFTFGLVTGCMLDYEGFYPIPVEWQSRYKASYALLELSLAMVNLIKCNRDDACNIPSN